jgi:hypothetical protein
MYWMEQVEQKVCPQGVTFAGAEEKGSWQQGQRRRASRERRDGGFAGQSNGESVITIFLLCAVKSKRM